MANWRYEFVAAQEHSSDLIVLEGRNFNAKDIYATRKVLSKAIRNKKVSGPSKPNAIRLLDSEGYEVWRGLLQSRRRKRGKTD
jgi:hypothetical protein